VSVNLFNLTIIFYNGYKRCKYFLIIFDKYKRSLKKKHILIVLTFGLFFSNCVRKKAGISHKKENQTALWTAVSTVSCDPKHSERKANIFYKVNTERLKEILDSTDNLSEGTVQNIKIPDDKGVLYEYELKPNYERSAEVISDFPNIRSYSGKSNSADLQLIITPEGSLFTLIFVKKKVYISNYCVDNEEIYYVH